MATIVLRVMIMVVVITVMWVTLAGRAQAQGVPTRRPTSSVTPAPATQPVATPTRRPTNVELSLIHI